MATTATTAKSQPTGFPTIEWAAEDLQTRPMPLHELPRQVGIDHAISVVARHHERIAKAITVFWGTRDCVEYLQKLVMNGGDGFGNARVGFKPEVVSALLSLASLHQVER